MFTQSKTGRTSNIAMVVYALCAAVIVAFAGSNLFVLNSAGGTADQVRRDVEQNLVRQEIGRQIEIVARDQSQISHWDSTLEALGATIDMDFIRTEIAEWMWDDFGIQSSIIIGGDGKPRVTVFEDSILAANDGLRTMAQSADLISLAKSKYMEHRRSRNGGFVIHQHPIRSERPIFVSDVRPIDGQLSVVVAQAIIPDDELVLPDGHPHVLLTYKPITKSVVANIQQKLGLANLAFVSGAAAAAGTNASQAIGQAGFRAVWQSQSPSGTIWQQALPLVAVLLVLIGGALLLVSVRYGRALSALQKSEQQNRFLALHDALTGLPNRLQFDRALEHIISEGAQDRCAILCMDLDRFKAVNDTYGHQAGDTVIKTVAKRIADAVGETGMAARIGGDEFIVLLRDRLDHQNVLRLCDELISSVCEEIDFDDGSAAVGASIGVAWWPDDAKTAKTIIRSADEALYRAKENGRGRTYLACDAGEATGDQIAA